MKVQAILVSALLLATVYAESCRLCTEMSYNSDNDDVMNALNTMMDAMEDSMTKCADAKPTNCTAGLSCVSVQITAEMEMKGMSGSEISMTTKMAMCSVAGMGICEEAEKNMDAYESAMTLKNVKCEEGVDVWSASGSAAVAFNLALVSSLLAYLAL